jgi:hypothetical protein
MPTSKGADVCRATSEANSGGMFILRWFIQFEIANLDASNKKPDSVSESLFA